MPNMSPDVSYLDAIRADSEALATAARAVGLSAPVPPCPEWDVEKLVRHVGRVFTSCAAVVRERGPVDFEALAPMPKGDGTVEAFEERSAAGWSRRSRDCRRISRSGTGSASSRRSRASTTGAWPRS